MRLHHALLALVALAALTGCPSPTNPGVSDTDPPAANSDASLASLSLAEASLAPAFSPDVSAYSATVSNSVSAVTVSASTTDPDASITSGLGTHALDVGTNDIAVVVRAANGSTKTYSISVQHQTADPGSDADLVSLSVPGVTLIPAFSSSVTSYTATVDYLVPSVTVAAVASSPSATIQSVTGSHALNVGTNSIGVVVRAEDSSQNTYTISITRQAAVERTFRAQRVTDSVWYNVPATLLGAGDHALVFVENTQTITMATAGAIADEFDTSIYNLVRDNFATESDVDGNGKVILLLLDIQDGFSGSGGYVAGYFDPTHLYSTSTYSNSNQADMLFLDTYPATAGSSSFYGTVAHEMQHLVNYYATVITRGFQQDLWINEGLSSGAEYLYGGGHVTSRISYYNADPAQTIRFGNNFYVWNGYWEQVNGDSLANYSTVYLFFQWLRIHASNGSVIYKDILSSTYRDYRSVVSAATSRISGTLSSWEYVLRTWMQANILNSPTGLTGYAGEITTTRWGFTNTGGIAFPLSSGEGLVVQTAAGSYTYTSGSGANIRYNGINTATGTLDVTGPTYTGDIVLVFNANTLIAGADQTAVLPQIDGVLPGSPLFSSTGAEIMMPEIYSVDIQVAPGGGLTPDSHRPASRPSAFQSLQTGDAWSDRR